MLTQLKSRSRAEIGWVMYDWANSAFATIVMAGFFPVFFKECWSAGVDVTVSTFRLGIVSSLSSIIMVFLSPFLGTIADRARCAKEMLVIFSMIGIAATVLLSFVAKGAWFVASSFYLIGVIGFLGACVFYDALLITVTGRQAMDKVSSWGFGAGYLGGGIALAMCVAAVFFHQTLGMTSPEQAVRFSFTFTALWWLIFMIPTILWVPCEEKKPQHNHTKGLWAYTKTSLQELAKHFNRLRTNRNTALFLGAYWLYIDGVDTIIRMAIDYGIAIGFASDKLILALLLVQFVGAPASLLFGVASRRFGQKKPLMIGIGVYAIVTIWSYCMSEQWEFFGIAVAIGLVQGGVQALSRSMFAEFVPDAEESSFFGFYNMLGRFAVILGPCLVGITSLLSNNSRVGMLSTLILFAGGALLLSLVKEPQKLHK